MNLIKHTERKEKERSFDINQDRQADIYVQFFFSEDKSIFILSFLGPATKGVALVIYYKDTSPCSVPVLLIGCNDRLLALPSM